MGINSIISDPEKIFVLEGSQCLQIEQYAGPMDDHPLWICKYLVEDSDYILKMHNDFLKAGADILLSVSYQTSVNQFQKCYGFSVEESIQKIHYSVELARKAWKKHLKNLQSDVKKSDTVGGSAGPYGACLQDGSEYTGTYIDFMSEEMLMDWHRPRAKALIEAGVDFLAFETLPSVVEGRAVLRLMKEFPNHKAWVSFNCKDNEKTARGELFDKTIKECWNLGKDQLLAVGVNCTSPMYIADLLKKNSDHSLPLVAYPNGGEIFVPNVGWTGNHVDLGSLAHEWIQLGAKFVGGCCKSTVADITSIRNVADSWNSLPHRR